MILNKRKSWLWIGLGLIILVLLTIFSAPNSSKLTAGSTYSKNPNGYGAWYEYISEQGLKVERWQKPFTEITQIPKQKKITYLKILPKELSALNSLSWNESTWVSTGHQLVILGSNEPVTEAPFISEQSTTDFEVQIKTTRRKEDAKKSLLEDEFGAVVWQEKVGQGEVIHAVTPYIAANAYQGVADNFEFLTSLIDKDQTIYVDEYIHGYKDLATKQQEKQATLSDYLQKTIWLPFAIQGLCLAIVALLLSWQRFGQKKLLKSASIDNSQAYIEALAGVLEKAESSDFVVKTIGKDEQLKLQKKLGLGRKILPAKTLIEKWSQQDKKPSTKLQELLKLSNLSGQMNSKALMKWIQNWQEINK